MRGSLLCLAVVAVSAAPVSLTAQDGFFFRQPIVTIGIQAGQALPSARDGVFDMFTRELTLKRGDFAASSFGADIGARVSPRIDIVLNVSQAKSSQPSEFRHWVDNNDQPIEQITTFRRIPATLSVRYFPMERGRAVGRHAWVPSSLLPYVGAGAGVVWYKLVQDGDFVDHETLDIFHDHLESSGSAGTGHVMAGAQWWPIARLGVTAEARYAWASATLKEGFREFNSIDLKGFQWTAGVAARF